MTDKPLHTMSLVELARHYALTFQIAASTRSGGKQTFSKQCDAILAEFSRRDALLERINRRVDKLSDLLKEKGSMS